MKGADKYTKVFTTTEQIGRLYIVSSRHARGNTLRIFVLPKGEEVISNGPHNAPLNDDAVEVFGIVTGRPGWTEEYGWLYKGPWVTDFNKKYEKRKKAMETREIKNASVEIGRVLGLLADY